MKLPPETPTSSLLPDVTKADFKNGVKKEVIKREAGPTAAGKIVIIKKPKKDPPLIVKTESSLTIDPESSTVDPSASTPIPLKPKKRVGRPPGSKKKPVKIDPSIFKERSSRKRGLYSVLRKLMPALKSCVFN